jgi:hypothetical protein
MKKFTQLESVGQRGQALDKGMIVMLISAAAVGAAYFLAQGSGGFLYLLSNGLPPILAFAAFIVSTAGLIRNGVRLESRVSTVWLGYSVGMLFWFLGEFTWAVYALWYSIPVPYPSIADGFWLAGYIPLLWAIMTKVWPFREFFSSRKMLTVLTVVFVLAGLMLVALVPTAFASGQDSLSAVVGLAYPLLDVTLIVVALPILFLFGRGTFWRPFLFVVAGLILTFLGDILFTWETSNGIYHSGSYLEAFFDWAYLILAYGFYLRFRQGTGSKMLE